MNEFDNIDAGYGDSVDAGYSRRSLAGIKSGVNKFLVPLKRFWWVMLPFMAASFSYFAHQTATTPITYLSYGKMVLTGRLHLKDSNVYQEAFANFFGTQAGIMESQQVKDRARKHLEATQPELLVQNPQALKYKVAHRLDTSFFDLIVESDHPQYAQAYLQSCMNEYLKLRREVQTSTTDTTLSAITADLTKITRAIRTGEDGLEEFLASNSMVFIEDQAKHTVETLLKFNEQKADVDRDFALMQSFLSMEHKSSDKDTNIEQFLFSLEILSLRDTGHHGGGSQGQETANRLIVYDQKFASIYDAFRKKRAEAKALDPSHHGEHPKVLQLNQELKKLEVELGYLKDQIEEQIVARAKGLVIRSENLQQEIEKWDAKSLVFNSKLAKHARMNTSLARLRERETTALANFSTIQNSQSLTENQELVAISQSATVAEKMEPMFIDQIPKAAALGLLTGLGFIFLFSRWKETVHSEVDLPLEAQAKLIAQIPRLRTSQQGLLQPDDTRHAFVESFRNLRSFVLIDGNQNITGDGAQVICITSAIPSEGKSTISSNLSVSLAQAGYKTLLIDADMRQGNQHKNFNTADNPGLSQILNDEVSWQSCVWPTESPNLEIIPRGPAVLNSSELILRPACHEIFQELKPIYQFVVIDTPPVLATDDVSNLLSDIDQLFLVCRLSLSNSRAMNQTIEMLHDRQANISGFVLNACGPSSTGYYKYRYYEQYGKA